MFLELDHFSKRISQNLEEGTAEIEMAVTAGQAQVCLEGRLDTSEEFRSKPEASHYVGRSDSPQRPGKPFPALQ